MKIVIIEDDDILRKSLVFFLKSKGYEVFDFDNGLQGLHFLNENYSDLSLVITDLNLPFTGGKQIVFEMKSKYKIPVIVLTASNVEATEMEILELGADDFITKPFSPNILQMRMERLLKV
ncbi:response regulator transcription factor [Flavobacterium cucumis]|uniref:Response regulator receiver domain-containing protein n=1 Tax=Flavobacterium cucumis TaxID=416016 RepID=A0A1M7ZXX0_9FLAO|nr:response regulator transcription factor [Flavobacterium cucumis]SHO73670.1 Response regulator receiver domain-containing protein [Flavobacterium cucumis]